MVKEIGDHLQRSLVTIDEAIMSVEDLLKRDKSFLPCFRCLTPTTTFVFGHRSILSKRNINHRPHGGRINKYHTSGHLVNEFMKD